MFFSWFGSFCGRRSIYNSILYLYNIYIYMCVLSIHFHNLSHVLKPIAELCSGNRYHYPPIQCIRHSVSDWTSMQHADLCSFPGLTSIYVSRCREASAILQRSLTRLDGKQKHPKRVCVLVILAVSAAVAHEFRRYHG